MDTPSPGVPLLGWTLHGVSHPLMGKGLFSKENIRQLGQGGCRGREEAGAEEGLHSHSFVTRAENSAGSVSCLS